MTDCEMTKESKLIEVTGNEDTTGLSADSMSIMTSEVNANHNSDNHPSNKKKRAVLKPRKSDKNKIMNALTRIACMKI